MLKRAGYEYESSVAVAFRDAVFPAPFKSGLEYASPARGTWNIVHTGMLIPESHQIFVCAEGCLRGVVLTAAEMGATERFSTIAVREQNVLDGNMEDIIIDGVADILKKLPYKPKAVLLYTSCIHHFLGCDLPLVYNTLRENNPDTDFVDCYMNPIMRKSGLNPDQLMRVRLYRLLKPQKLNPKNISIIANDFAVDKTSELYKVLENNGYNVMQIQNFKTYNEYQQMATCANCISLFPSARASGDDLEKRLYQKHIALKESFDFKEIEAELYKLCECLNIEKPDYSREREICNNELKRIAKLISDTDVVIDYTSFTRPLSLARLLLKYGINITRIYADGFTSDEQNDFEQLKREYPNIEVYPTVNTLMRVEKRTYNGKVLAIGQKAAYFTGTNHFVNAVESSGMYGYNGIMKLCSMIEDAYKNESDTKQIIQVKGWGCSC